MLQTGTPKSLSLPPPPCRPFLPPSPVLHVTPRHGHCYGQYFPFSQSSISISLSRARSLSLSVSTGTKRKLSLSPAVDQIALRVSWWTHSENTVCV